MLSGGAIAYQGGATRCAWCPAHAPSAGTAAFSAPGDRPRRRRRPTAGNAIPRATQADQFFVDTPIPAFPISWQHTGSSVFALAALALILPTVLPPTSSPRRVAALALLGTLSALIVDIYLY